MNPVKYKEMRDYYLALEKSVRALNKAFASIEGLSTGLVSSREILGEEDIDDLEPPSEEDAQAMGDAAAVELEKHQIMVKPFLRKR